MSTHKDNDFDFEPIEGLPEKPPQGEEILWSGTPEKWQLGHQIFHTRLIMAFFAVLAISSIFSGINHGAGAGRIAFTFSTLLIVGGLVVGFAVVLGWLIAINTVYTITSQRLVIRHGITMPMAVNFPFTKVANAAAKIRHDGSGDISMALLDGNRVSIFAIWPHNRPWSWQGAAPAIKSVSNAPEVAKILSDALVANAATYGTAPARPKVVQTRMQRGGRQVRTGPSRRDWYGRRLVNRQIAVLAETKGTQRCLSVTNSTRTAPSVSSTHSIVSRPTSSSTVT